jgi:hypothetical protein
MFISTFVFWGTQDSTLHRSNNKDNSIKYYTTQIKKSTLDVDRAKWSVDQLLEKKSIEIGEKIESITDQSVFVEFWRLATAFIWMSSWMITQDSLILSGNILNFSGEYPTLVSLYDPFKSYSITTKDRLFSIEEITNWSVYFWKEQDGTISVYSVDMVARLNFLYQWEKMTDMVIFPGMYIRFDPKENAKLKETDLFRILLTLDSSSLKDLVQQADSSSPVTLVEFVNLRMDNWNDRDIFLMYRLKEVHILFQMLHILFHDRVAQVDIMKKYGTDSSYTSVEDLSSWVINPSKRNYFLFRELQKVLSDAIQFPTERDEFRKKIDSINTQAKSFMAGNSITATLQQFLTDSRFMLFSSNGSNKKYEEIYNQVAWVLWISKSSGKYQFFQKLSDIYSQNMVTQKRDSAFSKIDTYTPTAEELVRSLQSQDIEQKDFFDIALYAFNVLKKTEEQWMFLKDAVHSVATYQLLDVFFNATNNYALHWPIERKNSTYKSMAIQFYDHLLSVLVRSLYSTFTETKGGYIYLKEGLVSNGWKIKLDDDPAYISTLRNLDRTIMDTLEQLTYVYQDESDRDTFLNIRQSINRFHGFILLSRDKTYEDYILTPYKATNEWDSSLPLLSEDKSTLIREAPPLEEAPIVDNSILDPNIKKIQTLIGENTNPVVVQDGDYYRLNSASIPFLESVSQLPKTYQVSMLFSRDLSTYTDVHISYADYSIKLYYITPGNVLNIQEFIQTLPRYINRIDLIARSNPNLKWEFIIYPEKWMVLIQNKNFNL